jgi:undecaprenyl diphosphate synthase
MKDLKIPNHVAIILDGNGRWATARGLKRSEGHKAGYENLKKLSKYIFSKGVKVLSIYVFSTENFGRDKNEVDYLMDTFVRAFSLEKKYFNKENIKIIFSGRDEPLPKKVIEARDKIVDYTKNNTRGILNICLNYGGRAEIVDACRKIINDNISSDNLDEKVFSKYLYQDLPDVDLMIRTSGELRLSNFLLWQNSYSEFYFPTVPFPDFNEEEFDKALVEYTKRDRRFGKINLDKK